MLDLEHICYLMVFDYKYITTFEKGGNYEDDTSISVETRIYNYKGEYYKTFPKNKNIQFKIKDWLELTGTNLSDENHAVDRSKINDVVKEARYPIKRLTGLDIIIKIECTNLKKDTKENYGTTLCEVNPIINEGWASKGSKINYILYPNLLNNQTQSIYFDRYRYGIKIKFLITGMIGEFSIINFLNGLISTIVLTGTATTILIIVITNFMGGYTEKLNNESKTSSKNIKLTSWNKFLLTFQVSNPIF